MNRNQERLNPMKQMAAAAAAGLLLGLAAATVMQAPSTGETGYVNLSNRTTSIYAEAAQPIGTSLQNNPDDPALHTDLAIVHHKAGTTEEAVKHYSNALRLNPDHQPARAGKAMAYSEMAMEELAEADRAEADQLRSSGDASIPGK